MSADFELVPALRAAAKYVTSLCPQYEKDHLCYMAAEEIDRLQAECDELKRRLLTAEARCKALEDALRGLQVGYRLKGWEGDPAYLEAERLLAK